MRCVRGWPQPVLERHIEELHKAVLALISDADGAARSVGRLLFWSFTALFPFRAESLLGALSAKVQVWKMGKSGEECLFVVNCIYPLVDFSSAHHHILCVQAKSCVAKLPLVCISCPTIPDQR